MGMDTRVKRVRDTPARHHASLLPYLTLSAPPLSHARLVMSPRVRMDRDRPALNEEGSKYFPPWVLASLFLVLKRPLKSYFIGVLYGSWLNPEFHQETPLQYF